MPRLFQFIKVVIRKIPVTSDLFRFCQWSAKYSRKFYLNKFAAFGKKSILSHKHYGFRKKISTVHALLNLTAEIQKSWDMKTAVKKAVLWKAFGTVDQTQLLEVFYSLDFRGPIHEFLTSYLLSRSQRVRIKRKVSKPKPIHFGELQGSLLGPLLFILYVNEITRASSQLDLILFADDTVHIQNHSTDQIDFQNGVNDIVVWLNNRKLSINCNKTFEVLFSRNKNLDCSLFPEP